MHGATNNQVYQVHQEDDESISLDRFVSLLRTVSDHNCERARPKVKRTRGRRTMKPKDLSEPDIIVYHQQHPQQLQQQQHHPQQQLQQQENQVAEYEDNNNSSNNNKNYESFAILDSQFLLSSLINPLDALSVDSFCSDNNYSSSSDREEDNNDVSFIKQIRTNSSAQKITAMTYRATQTTPPRRFSSTPQLLNTNAHQHHQHCCLIDPHTAVTSDNSSNIGILEGMMYPDSRATSRRASLKSSDISIDICRSTSDPTHSSTLKKTTKLGVDEEHYSNNKCSSPILRSTLHRSNCQRSSNNNNSKTVEVKPSEEPPSPNKQRQTLMELSSPVKSPCDATHATGTLSTTATAVTGKDAPPRPARRSLSSCSASSDQPGQTPQPPSSNNSSSCSRSQRPKRRGRRRQPQHQQQEHQQQADSPAIPQTLAEPKTSDDVDIVHHHYPEKMIATTPLCIEGIANLRERIHDVDDDVDVEGNHRPRGCRRPQQQHRTLSSTSNRSVVSDVSSLGMGSVEAFSSTSGSIRDDDAATDDLDDDDDDNEEDEEDEEWSHHLLRIRRQPSGMTRSICPSVDTALQGMVATTTLKGSSCKTEDLLPRRPSRCRSRSPRGRRLLPTDYYHDA